MNLMGSGVEVIGRRVHWGRAEKRQAGQDSAAPVRVRNCAEPRPASGLTLIEFLVTVAVMGVVLVFGIPSFKTYIQNARIRTAADQLLVSIQQARTEAIRRGSMVILCRTGDPNDLHDGTVEDVPACRLPNYPEGGTNQSFDWSRGWLVYAAPSATSERDFNPAAAGEELLFLGMRSGDGVKVSSNVIGNSWLAFHGDGTLNEAGAAFYAVCDGRGDTHGKLVSVFLSGRATIEGPPVADCTP